MGILQEIANSDYIDDIRLDALEAELFGDLVYCANNCGRGYSRSRVETSLKYGFCPACQQRIVDDYHELLAKNFNKQELLFLNCVYEGEPLDAVIEIN